MMIKLRHPAILALVIYVGLADIVPVYAQPSAVIGDRVRIMVPGGPWIGVIRTITVDSLTLQIGLRDRTFPISRLQRVEYSAGTKSRAGRGMTIGFLGGAVAGGGSIGFVASGCQGEFMCRGAGAAMLLGAVLGGLGGAFVGGVIGATMPSERWKVATLRPSVSFAPATSKPTFGLSVRL